MANEQQEEEKTAIQRCQSSEIVRKWGRTMSYQGSLRGNKGNLERSWLLDLMTLLCIKFKRCVHAGGPLKALPCCHRRLASEEEEEEMECIQELATFSCHCEWKPQSDH